MKNSSYYIAPVGDRTHDLPHTVASNMVKVSHALNHSATEENIVGLSETIRDKKEKATRICCAHQTIHFGQTKITEGMCEVMKCIDNIVDGRKTITLESRDRARWRQLVHGRLIVISCGTMKDEGCNCNGVRWTESLMTGVSQEH